MEKFSKSPYKVELSMVYPDETYVVRDPGGLMIGCFHSKLRMITNYIKVPAKANATLFAAAPDLLEALELIVKCEINRRKDLQTLASKPSSLYTFSDARVRKAQAAIAKARGK